MHSRSVLVYKLTKRYGSFRARVGVDDEVGNRGSVVFKVFVNGKSRYTSPVLRGSQGSRAVLVGLTGATTLKLVVTKAGDGAANDHADWARARLTPHKKKTTTTTPTPANPPSSARGCAAHPSVCGYPDASNTGVPAGTTLRTVPGQVSSGPGWHWDPRGWLQVDGAGAVLDGISVKANVDITASNVTIKNSRVVLSGESFGISLRHTSDVTIQDSEIYSPQETGAGRLMVSIKDIYGDSTGLAILRNEIWHTATGVQVESGLIQDNYIHDLGYKDGDHVNGTTSNGGSRALTLRHNTVFNQYDQTDAISLFQDFGPQANRVIDNNLLAGGGYTIYAGANPGKANTATNIKVTNNRISRMYYPNGGSYGPVTAYTSGGGNTWTGNIWDDTGKIVNAPK